MKKKMKYLIHALLYIIYFFSGLFKRNKKLWIIASFTGNYDENPKYLHLNRKIIENEYNIKIIWIFNSKKSFNNYKIEDSCYLYSFKGLYLALTAKYYLINSYVSDISFWLSKGAKIINLWHGIPLKKVEYDIINGPLRNHYHVNSKLEQLIRFLNVPHKVRGCDYIIAQSAFVAKILSTAFKVSHHNILETGYARDYPLLNDKDISINLIKQYEEKDIVQLLKEFNNFDSVVMYIPTWRDDNESFILEALPNLKELNKTCKKYNILFIIKLHHNSKLPEIHNYSFENIKFISKRIDIYPFLRLIDLLITDYSSVLFDYLLLNKPALFYIYDFENYSKQRNFYEDIKDILYGRIAYNFEELLKALIELKSIKNNSNTSTVKTKYLSNTNFDFGKIYKAVSK